MKVTIIYDRFKGVNVQTIILKDEVRYYAQNDVKASYRYQGFYDLDTLYEYISNRELQFEGLSPFDYVHKMGFNTEEEMCKWISSLCESSDDLTEIFIK